MEHKHATLLRQAADDADARFKSPPRMSDYDITFVLSNPNEDWQLVKKHYPYAELKKAYAEGKAIQVRLKGTDKWQTSVPAWNFTEYEYRIKPQTVTKWLFANDNGLVYEYLTEKPHNSFTIKLEWSATEFEVTE